MFRSGCTWKRGSGKIFYVRPAMRPCSIYFHSLGKCGATPHWTAPEGQRWIDTCPHIPINQAREKLVAKGPRLHREGDEGFR